MRKIKNYEKQNIKRLMNQMGPDEFLNMLEKDRAKATSAQDIIDFDIFLEYALSL